MPTDPARPACAERPRALLLEPAEATGELPLASCFGNPGPLEIDLGCGKGRFLVTRASRHPATNFLGVDRQTGRLRKVEAKCLRANLSNVRLLRAEASHALRCLLPARSVRALYVFFPDPWPKRRHHRRRLFAPGFPAVLRRVLTEEGIVHAATDHADYLEQIRAVFGSDGGFVEAPPYVPDEEERTDFERLFVGLGHPIGRCSFRCVGHSQPGAGGSRAGTGPGSTASPNP